MPIIILGVAIGAFVTHIFHSEVRRQAHQEARLNELHEKMSAHMEALNEKVKKA
jgi:uncharacterized membrane-anchored protein YhcB (DUF1043 family)